MRSLWPSTLTSGPGVRTVPSPDARAVCGYAGLLTAMCLRNVPALVWSSPLPPSADRCRGLAAGRSVSGWRFRHPKDAPSRALDGDLCAARGCPARGDNPAASQARPPTGALRRSPPGGECGGCGPAAARAVRPRAKATGQAAAPCGELPPATPTACGGSPSPVQLSPLWADPCSCAEHGRAWPRRARRGAPLKAVGKVDARRTGTCLQIVISTCGSDADLRLGVTTVDRGVPLSADANGS